MTFSLCYFRLGILHFLLIIGMVFPWIMGISQSQSMHFEHLDEFPEIAYHGINTLYQDRTGFIWIGTEGIFRYDGHSLKQYGDSDAPSALASSSITFFFEDSHHRMWTGTRAGGLGLYLREEDRFIGYRHDPGDSTSLSHDYVNCMYEDSQGQLWIGTDKGISLMEVNGIEVSFTHYFHNPNDPNSLSHNEVTCIHEYPSHILWIGTDRGGINRFDLKDQTFTRYVYQNDNPYSIRGNIVKSMLVDTFHSRPCLWAAIFGGGLMRLSLPPDRIPADSFQYFRRNLADTTTIPSNRLMSLTRDSRGTIWIGTFARGLAAMHQQGDSISFTHYPSNPQRVGSISSSIIWEVFEDRQGMLWVGTDAGGIFRTELPEPLFEHHLIPPLGEYFPSQFITSILEDESHHLWLGTEGSGLFRYHKNKETLDHYSVNQGNLAHAIVTCLHKDAEGIIWAGTYGGLTRIDPLTNETKHFRHRMEIVPP